MSKDISINEFGQALIIVLAYLFKRSAKDNSAYRLYDAILKWVGRNTVIKADKLASNVERYLSGQEELL